MSTSKLDTSRVFQPVTVQTQTTALRLSWTEVAIRDTGIEFLSAHPIPAYTELTVELRSPVEAKPVRGNGVVVDCSGNRHTGYVVSLLFMGLTRQSQERLTQLAWLQGA
jgi:hypothetical protein